VLPMMDVLHRAGPQQDQACHEHNRNRAAHRQEQPTALLVVSQ
jgi:hypothetical protein